ncbi:MAG: hypothetical protein JSR91_23475 [Proteobacteria bacterium]|nr:hypothetical protein [Pseudomonadota bacterium]
METHDKPTPTHLTAALWAHEWSRLLDSKSAGKADEVEARFWARLVKEAKTGEERGHLIDHIATLAEDASVSVPSK